MIDFKPLGYRIYNSTAYLPIVASTYRLYYDVESRLEKNGVISDRTIPYDVFFETVEKISREHYYAVDTQLSGDVHAIRRS